MSALAPNWKNSVENSNDESKIESSKIVKSKSLRVTTKVLLDVDITVLSAVRTCVMFWKGRTSANGNKIVSAIEVLGL